VLAIRVRPRAGRNRRLNPSPKGLEKHASATESRLRLALTELTTPSSRRSAPRAAAAANARAAHSSWSGATDYPDHMAYEDDLALALSLADAVDTLTVAGSLGDFAVEFKADDTPVTAIDRAAEQLIRDRLTAERPADTIVGEEFGVTAGTNTLTSTRRWVVDPIDGTKNFVRGVPAWATLIGLIVDDVAVMGVVSAPALGRRWYAAQGSGAWSVTTLQGFPSEPQQLSVSSTPSVNDAFLSLSSLTGWEDRSRLDSLLDLTRTAQRTRGFGDFWSYMLVAEGAVDIACEPELALHDMAALVPIVTEAGGAFTSWAGTPGPFGGDAVATNGAIHDEVLGLLAAR